MVFSKKLKPLTVPKEFQYLRREEELTLTNCDREPVHLIGQVQAGSYLYAFRPGQAWSVLCVSENIAELTGIEVDAVLQTPVKNFLGDDVAKHIAHLVEHEPQRILEFRSIALGALGLDKTVTLRAHMSADVCVIELGKTSPDTYAMIFEELHEADVAERDAELFAARCVENLRQVTGFDQIIVYRFDDCWHGQAIAESKLAESPSYLHSWFPDSDIPLPARVVMQQRPVAVHNNHVAEGVPLRFVAPSAQQLDLGKCIHRYASRMCSRYYLNMEVHGTAVASLIFRERLWGFISFWNYRRPVEMSFAQRQKIEAYAKAFMTMYKRKVYEENAQIIRRFQAKKEEVINSLQPQDTSISTLVRLPRFESILPSSGAAVIKDNNAFLSGETPPKDMCIAIANWIAANHPNTATFTHRNLSAVFPQAADHQDTASGILAVRIGNKTADGAKYLIWFRKESDLIIDWAGEPEKKPDPNDPEGQLLPRNSFNLWKEKVQGWAQEWRSYEIELAEEFRDELIQVLNELTMIELNEALTLAAENQKAKERFLANISHEIRTPANGILGNAELLSEQLHDPDNQAIANDLVLSSKILLRLINDILDQSKIQAGKLTLNNDVFNIKDSVATVVSTLKPLSSEMQVSLTTEFDSEIPYLIGDQIRFTQIVLNLCSNAMKFSSAQSEVTISIATQQMSQDNCSILLQVIDSGRGIPKDHLASIRMPFTQVDASDTRIAGGVGLGLSIVSSLVKEMNGSFDLESELGKGTTARVILPFGIGDEQALKSQAHDLSTIQIRSKLDGLHVLVAEDNVVNQRLVQILLKQCNCTCEITNDGVEAVEAASFGKYDLYLFDIQMPNMDGLEALRHIRQDDRINFAPAIALTAHVGTEDKDRFLNNGFQGFLAKPINKQSLHQGMLAALNL